MNTHTQTITLADSRQLSFTDLGDADAPAIFFVHGSGSAADGLELDTRAQHRKVRIVSPARPGIGGSTTSPGRRMSDWADDVAQLADHLGVDRFATLGISGGGPYAIAVASALPERVVQVGVISCGGPFDAPRAFEGMGRANRMMWSAIDRRRRLARFMLGQQAKLVAKNPTKATERVIKTLTGTDKDAVGKLTSDQQRRLFAEPMMEALANGPEAMFQDMAILRRPWDFDLSHVETKVHLWHGGADTSAPVAMAEHLVAHLPNCVAHFEADAGHLSTILTEIDDALVVLRGQRASGDC